jgi:hypothetical protein
MNLTFLHGLDMHGLTILLVLLLVLVIALVNVFRGRIEGEREEPRRQKDWLHTEALRAPCVGRLFRSPLFSISWLLYLLAFFIVSNLFPCLAQPSSAPSAQDPLMSLMLSQPKIDVESPVIASAVFDPPVVRPGETSIYRLTFTALEESIELPADLPAPPGLTFRPGGHGQMLSMSGTTLQPRTSFNFRLRPTEAGTISIPEFVVTVYGKPVTVPATRLEVIADLPPTIMPAQCLVLELPQTNLFVGQSIPVDILFPGLVGIGMQGQSPVQLIGQGFLADPTSFRPRFEPRMSALGRNVQTYIYQGTITPITAGKLSFFAQSFVAIRAVAVSPGPLQASPNYTLLDSAPVELQVRPLPLEGRLPGFAGAVGDFTIGMPELATNVVRVGDPVKLTVKVRGEGNLLRLVAPAPPRLRYWQAVASSGEHAPPQIIQAQGFTTFTYALVPLSEKAHYTPAIPFSCFDPQREMYRDLTIRSVPITVLPGSVPADLAALVHANSLSDESEKEPTLSGLAPAPGLGAVSLAPLQQRIWFPLAQLAPALAFTGLWGWDRRRRYLEEHPDIVLRNRARRALRRERRRVNKALQSGDASAFAATAANALRVACAPHFPAEPRALVGSDVLSMFSKGEQASRTGEVVRQLFAVNDAAHFDVKADNASDVLELQPEFEIILRRLEERL